ncbi:hypothetical protein HPP92_005801 [Vanilla planifolia]|uniref:Disease resistance R13L4/SHOC-2-like LRR domain-containing protein n=1 Tax=Vanilla planifolia TaxID=51239 RepID=A0A835S097_VANPL|nr:hypothetical protein HPP92_005801 [Vanilla planifolia]
MTHLCFSLAVLLLVRFWSPAECLTNAADTVALANLKAAVLSSSMPPFSCLSSWNFSGTTDPCRNFLCGISCSTYGRIISVSLDSAGYYGHLPSAISNLTHLQVLDLSNNFFNGPVPSSLSSLSNLKYLILTSNNFSGPIPFSILSNLSSLITLELSGNSLSGTLPPSLSSLSALTILDLSYNHLSGTLIQSAFEPLKRLEVADLAGNQLSGAIKGWLLRLPKIQQVNLANNTFNKWEVWPALLGGGDELVAIDLGYNRIEGQLPEELAEYTSLVALTVSHNSLRGGIPWQYLREKKGAAFRRLFLDGNFLQGRVPVELIGEEMIGSFGDNCFVGCPSTSAFCSPGQKPGWLCKAVNCTYSGGQANRRRRGSCGV